jgi:hypothetical protein
MTLDEVLLDDDLLSVLPHAHTRQSWDANARFSRVFFWSFEYNLYLSEVSDQLDVTFERSKRVKLALTWVATTQSDAIK